MLFRCYFWCRAYDRMQLCRCVFGGNYEVPRGYVDATFWCWSDLVLNNTRWHLDVVLLLLLCNVDVMLISSRCYDCAFVLCFMLTLLWCYVDVMLMSCWCHDCVAVMQCRCYVDFILMLRLRFRVVFHVVAVLMLCWCRVDVMIVSSWRYAVVMLIRWLSREHQCVAEGNPWIS